MKLYSTASSNYCIVPYTAGQLVQGECCFDKFNQGRLTNLGYDTAGKTMKLYSTASSNYCIVPYTAGQLVQGECCFDKFNQGRLTNLGYDTAGKTYKRTNGTSSSLALNESKTIKLTVKNLDFTQDMMSVDYNYTFRFYYPGTQKVWCQVNDYVDFNGQQNTPNMTLEYTCDHAFVNYKTTGSISQAGIFTRGVEGYIGNGKFCAKQIKTSGQESWSAEANEFINSDEKKTHFMFIYRDGDSVYQDVNIKCTSSALAGSEWTVSGNNWTSFNIKAKYPTDYSNNIEVPHSDHSCVPCFLLQFSPADVDDIDIESAIETLNSYFVKA